MSEKGKLAGYWVATGIIALSQGASGVMDFLGAEPVVEGITALGYPTYILYILGFWKIAAVPALLVEGFPRIKEWAYAGLFFDFTGAFASHALNGDPVQNLVSPLVLTGVLFASYQLRPASRRLAGT